MRQQETLGVGTKPWLVVDIETTSTDILSIGWQEIGGTAARAKAPEDVPPYVWRMLADPVRPTVEFTKFDARRLREAGYVVEGPIIDLQVMAWVLNENQPLDLESLVKRYLGKAMDKRLVKKNKAMWFHVGGPVVDCLQLMASRSAKCDHLVPIEETPKDELHAYCRRDVAAETELLKFLWFKLNEQDWLDYFVAEEVPYTSVLLDMELAGLPINMKESELLRAKLDKERTRLRNRLITNGKLPPDFNVNSDDQVAEYLFKRKSRIPGKVLVSQGPPVGFKVKESKKKWIYGEWEFKGRDLPVYATTDSGAPSTSRIALLVNKFTVKDDWVQTLLEYRRLEQLLSVYLEKFPDVQRNGRIYSQFKQTGTVTGRLSSADINLQNIPKRHEHGAAVRGLFQGTPDRSLILGDYNQLEMRLMAHFSQDPELLRIYQENRDFHSETAYRIFGHKVEKGSEEREIAKRMVYGMSYGAMGLKLSEVLSSEGFPTEPETAEEYLRELRHAYKVFFQWRDEVIAKARHEGYVATIGGRYRRVKTDIRSSDWRTQGYGERAAANARVQGSAGDIVRRMMCRWVHTNMRLLVQVHDEVVFQYHRTPSVKQQQRDLVALRRCAEKEHGFDLSVPLVFEPVVGMSWADKA